MKINPLILLTLFILGCSEKKITAEYTPFLYQPDIQKEVASIWMNNKYVKPTLGDDDLMIKFSTDARLVVINDSSDFFYFFDEMRCRSWIDNDTLHINIVSTDGLTGYGCRIKVKGDKFSCFPYDFVDVIIPDGKEPVITIEKQELTLNKNNFHVGDSLYGRFYMRGIVDTVWKKYAMGYFRTKIEKR